MSAPTTHPPLPTHHCTGIQYTFGRVPMGACDFSTDPEWSYDDVKGDVTLQNFTLVRSRGLNAFVVFLTSVGPKCLLPL